MPLRTTMNAQAALGRGLFVIFVTTTGACDRVPEVIRHRISQYRRDLTSGVKKQSIVCGAVTF